MSTLPRVRPGLLRHRLDEQSLVYDPRDDKVHLLDPTTACVLDLLEEGGWSIERMKTEVARRMNIQVSDDILTLSFDELRKADLIDAGEPAIAPVSDMARREMLRKIGFVGAAALAVPIITTLTATPAYAACTGRIAQGGGCVASSQCCSGVCSSGRCT